MFKDHFSSVADPYARYRPEYPPGLFAELARLAPARRIAWDCGTGGGQAARGLALHFSKVLATDASAAQISRARAPCNVRFAVASAGSCELDTRSADVVTVAQALHWFDLGEFYTEARRVLAAGGIIAVWCYSLLRVAPAIDSILDDLYRDVLGRFWPAERRHVEAGYRDLCFPFAELAFEKHELSLNWTLRELGGYLNTWSALTACREQTGNDPLPPVMEELGRAWGAGQQRRLVQWPLHVRVGIRE